MRVIKILLLVCIFTLIFSSVAFADTSIEDRFNIRELLDEVDSAATIIVATIRTIATVMTVILIASVGFTLWNCKDSQTLEIVKTRLYFIFAGLFVIFLTEPIVKFVTHLVSGE